MTYIICILFNMMICFIEGGTEVINWYGIVIAVTNMTSKLKHVGCGKL